MLDDGKPILGRHGLQKDELEVLYEGGSVPEEAAAEWISELNYVPAEKMLDESEQSEKRHGWRFRVRCTRLYIAVV